MSMIFDLGEAESKINYIFKNKSLLRQAFTHSSYSNENHVQSNERLEFLGDSILNHIIADYLYKKFPDAAEGQLTKMRADLVSAMPLSEAVSMLEINELMLFGEGEKRTAEKSYNIFADLFESVAAAIYLDSGMKEARAFILAALKKQLDRTGIKEIQDYKSKLSELCQKRYKRKVKYDYSEDEPSKPQFTVAAVINGKAYAPATARNKKTAEKLAAKNALEVLQQGEQI